jgi:hypothetical protein
MIPWALLFYLPLHFPSVGDGVYAMSIAVAAGSGLNGLIAFQFFSGDCLSGRMVFASSSKEDLE